jgi:4-azaleucine resistance transporter AzlC
MSASHNLRTVMKDGIAAAWPICLGYAPIGLAFGVLAQKAGLSPGEIGLMSLLVFAGSAQFIAVSMISGGAAAVPIILTTFTVNLRHLLMSSSLAVHLRGLNAGWLSLYAYGVTDESFALNMARFREESWDWRRALVLNHTANLAWIFSTIIGGYSGQFIPPAPSESIMPCRPCSSVSWSFRSRAVSMSQWRLFRDYWPSLSRCCFRAMPILLRQR